MYRALHPRVRRPKTSRSRSVKWASSASWASRSSKACSPLSRSTTRTSGAGETSSIVFENLNSPTTNSMYATRASTMHDAPVVLARDIRHAAEQSAENRSPRGHDISPSKRRQRANGVARPNLNQNVVHKNLKRARACSKQRTRHGVARGASYRKGKKTRHRKKKRHAESPSGERARRRATIRSATRHRGTSAETPQPVHDWPRQT